MLVASVLAEAIAWTHEKALAAAPRIVWRSAGGRWAGCGQAGGQTGVWARRPLYTACLPAGRALQAGQAGMLSVGVGVWAGQAAERAGTWKLQAGGTPCRDRTTARADSDGRAEGKGWVCCHGKGHEPVTVRSRTSHDSETSTRKGSETNTRRLETNWRGSESTWRRFGSGIGPLSALWAARRDRGDSGA